MTAAPPSDDQDLLAAEYVLGTLDPDERAQARALASVDSAFAASVRAWEQRFADLCVMVEPVDPPAPAWEAIKAKITPGEPAVPMELPAVEEPVAVEPVAEPEPVVETATAARGSGLWRGVAIIACLIALILSADVLTGLYAPELLPEALRPRPVATAPTEPTEAKPAEPQSTDIKPTETAPANAKPVEAQPDEQKSAATGTPNTEPAGTAGAEVTMIAPPVTGSATPQTAEPTAAPAATPAAHEPAIDRFAAVLQKDADNAGFVLTLDSDRSKLTARRIGAAAEAGKSYQLWILSERFPGPRSLGVIGAGDFTVVEGLSVYDRETLDGATFAVSLEPEGGSVSGVASEPFLFKGKLVSVRPETQPAADTAAAPNNKSAN